MSNHEEPGSYQELLYYVRNRVKDSSDRSGPITFANILMFRGHVLYNCASFPVLIIFEIFVYPNEIWRVQVDKNLLKKIIAESFKITVF